MSLYLRMPPVPSYPSLFHGKQELPWPSLPILLGLTLRHILSGPSLRGLLVVRANSNMLLDSVYLLS